MVPPVSIISSSKIACLSSTSPITVNDFYLHSDEDGEIALNTSLIQAIEFNDEDDNKRGAGLVSSD